MRVINTLYLCLGLSFSATSDEIPVNYFFTDYNEKIADLAVKEKECSDKTRVLDKNIFEEVNVPSEKISVILAYKDINAFVNCTKKARLEYYKSSLLLRLSSTNYHDTLKASDKLISMHDLRLLKSKEEYEKIDIHLRKEIDVIKDLDKSFNLIGSFDVITSK